jgi:hypothetical protein
MVEGAFIDERTREISTHQIVETERAFLEIEL